LIILFFNKNKSLRSFESSNHLFFVFKTNTPVLQYSSTPILQHSKELSKGKEPYEVPFQGAKARPGPLGLDSLLCNKILMIVIPDYDTLCCEYLVLPISFRKDL
jgi:hypothetical protein